MSRNSVHFSIAKHAQWAPCLVTDPEWQAWLQSPFEISTNSDQVPAVAAMPAMLRRRVRFLGRMALEVAYQCVDDLTQIPTVFCSQHGEVAHSVDLISEQIATGAVSPIGFSSSVHNATAGLFSIARKDRNQHIALAAGANTVEHAVIEACSLLEDGAPAVLLVNYEQPLPEVFRAFEECHEQAYAWAWLMVPALESNQPNQSHISLSWNSHSINQSQDNCEPAGLQVLRFYLGQQACLQRTVKQVAWTWSRKDVANTCV